MLRFSLSVIPILLLLVSSCGAGATVSICDLADDGLLSLPPEGVRVTAVFVPNALHGAYFTDPNCPSTVIPAAFPDKNKLEEFFNAAYSGGGVATKLKVDATVKADSSEANGDRGVVLRIEQVHSFTDVSVIRPPRPHGG